MPFTFLRAPPGTFLVPDGWQVNEASLKAWQIEDHHVLTMSPPGKPDVVLGLRQFLKVMRPERAIHIASLPAKIVEVLEDKKGAGEGLYARWVARVVLDGKPAVMGMYSWATLANEQTGKRNVRLAALLTPTMAEFESFGGIDNLRRLAYAQSYHAANDPELELAGEYLGAEGTGGWSDPYTGQSTPSGFGLSLALNGKQISVLHYRQVATGVGISYTSTVARMARGTFIRDRGMIVPTWSECSLEIIANGVPGGRSACEAGWGATIHLLPRSDGSFLARMPGMEAINSVDEPGTVVVQRKQ